MSSKWRDSGKEKYKICKIKVKKINDTKDRARGFKILTIRAFD